MGTRLECQRLYSIRGDIEVPDTFIASRINESAIVGQRADVFAVRSHDDGAVTYCRVLD